MRSMRFLPSARTSRPTAVRVLTRRASGVGDPPRDWASMRQTWNRRLGIRRPCYGAVRSTPMSFERRHDGDRDQRDDDFESLAQRHGVSVVEGEEILALARHEAARDEYRVSVHAWFAALAAQRRAPASI